MYLQMIYNKQREEFFDRIDWVFDQAKKIPEIGEQLLGEVIEKEICDWGYSRTLESFKGSTKES